MNAIDRATTLALLGNFIPLTSKAQSVSISEAHITNFPVTETPVYVITRVDLNTLKEENGGLLLSEGVRTASVQGPARLIPIVLTVSSSGIADFILLGAAVIQPTTSINSINFETISVEFKFHDNAFSTAKIFRVRIAMNVLEVSFVAKVDQPALLADLPHKLIGSKTSAIDATTVRSNVHNKPISNVSVVGSTASMSAISEKSPILILNTDQSGIVEAVCWQ